MTARESGYDGVNFYFGSGEDDCAFAWTPRGVGPGGLIADMITEASGRAPSTTKLLELARSIDRVDGRRQAGQQTSRRSEERRVGNERVRTCNSRWWP